MDYGYRFLEPCEQKKKKGSSMKSDFVKELILHEKLFVGHRFC